MDSLSRYIRDLPSELVVLILKHAVHVRGVRRGLRLGLVNSTLYYSIIISSLV